MKYDISGIKKGDVLSRERLEEIVGVDTKTVATYRSWLMRVVELKSLIERELKASCRVKGYTLIVYTDDRAPKHNRSAIEKAMRTVVRAQKRNGYTDRSRLDASGIADHNRIDIVATNLRRAQRKRTIQTDAQDARKRAAIALKERGQAEFRSMQEIAAAAAQAAIDAILDKTDKRRRVKPS